MPNTKLPAADVQVLDGIADSLMWLGLDRAADAIYVAIEADAGAACDCSTGQWADVFAG